MRTTPTADVSFGMVQIEAAMSRAWLSSGDPEGRAKCLREVACRALSLAHFLETGEHIEHGDAEIGKALGENVPRAGVEPILAGSGVDPA